MNDTHAPDLQVIDLSAGRVERYSLTDVETVGYPQLYSRTRIGRNITDGAVNSIVKGARDGFAEISVS